VRSGSWEASEAPTNWNRQDAIRRYCVEVDKTNHIHAYSLGFGLWFLVMAPSKQRGKEQKSMNFGVHGEIEVEVGPLA
jgi:hypothetical protein